MAIEFDGGASSVYGLGWGGYSETRITRVARVVARVDAAATERWTEVEGGVVNTCV